MKIKYCGFTNVVDVHSAVSLGVDYIGFILEQSNNPRSISFELFKELQPQLEIKGSKIVVVLIDPAEEIIQEIIGNKLANAIQLHGTESLSLYKKYYKQIDLIKAYSVEPEKTDQELELFVPYSEMIILDNPKRELTEIEEEEIFSKKLEISEGLKTIGGKVGIAGGIDNSNVKGVINRFQPYIIDLASSIETEPGQKDYRRMKELIQRLKK